MRNINRAAKAIKPKTDEVGVTLVRATVVDKTPPTVTLQFADGTQALNVKYLHSYSATVGDVVWALKFRHDLLVLGTQE